MSVINFRYQNESAELSHWLQSALDRLEFWTTQSVTVPQELETVRDHLYAFLVSPVINEQHNKHQRPNNNLCGTFFVYLFVSGRSFPRRLMQSHLCVHRC